MFQFLFLKGWLSGVGEEIMGAIEHSVRTLSFSLISIIYGLIIKLYDLFELLCTARLLDTELLNELSKRVGLILGIVMFFIITFSLIKMLIEPDKINDKEMGAAAILKKIIIVIILLGVSNFVFNLLYGIQRTVVQSHVISNLLLPYSLSDDSYDKFGGFLSSELLLSFYSVEDFSSLNLADDNKKKVDKCKNMVKAFENQIVVSNEFDLGYNCLNDNMLVNVNIGSGVGSQDLDVYIINYNWFLCIVVGVFAAYILLMYCFKVGVRMIQLMFLEVISPMAIVSYLSPKKDTMFDKWTKVYVSTYIDVFIRIAIINFIFFLIATIFSVTANSNFIFWESIGNPTDSGTRSFLTVVIVLSLLTFAKKAPDLLKELLPAGASKLGFGMSMKDVVGLNKGVNTLAGLGTGAAVGLIGGIAGGRGLSRVTGALGGVLGGAFRGGASGFGSKGFGSAISGAAKNQAAFNVRRSAALAGGSTFFGRQLNNFQKTFGLETAGDVDARNLESLNNYTKLQDSIEGHAENNSVVKKNKRAYEALVQAGKNEGESDSAYTERLEKARKTYKNSLEAVINSAMSDQSNATYVDAQTGQSESLEVEKYIGDSIRSGRDQINREIDNNRSLFGDYSHVNDYSQMDDNTNRARRDTAQLTSTESYARNQANNKFSTKK